MSAQPMSPLVKLIAQLSFILAITAVSYFLALEHFGRDHMTQMSPVILAILSFCIFGITGLVAYSKSAGRVENHRILGMAAWLFAAMGTWFFIYTELPKWVFHAAWVVSLILISRCIADFVSGVRGVHD